MSFLSNLFGSDPLGEVKYYQTKNKKWRWKVVNSEGNTIVNPIKSFHTRSEAVQSFLDVQGIVESI